MLKSTKQTKRGQQAAFVIGLLFIILGSSTQSDTSWLFTIAGMLSLAHGLFDLYKAKPTKSK